MVLYHLRVYEKTADRIPVLTPADHARNATQCNRLPLTSVAAELLAEEKSTNAAPSGGSISYTAAMHYTQRNRMHPFLLFHGPKMLRTPSHDWNRDDDRR